MASGLRSRRLLIAVLAAGTALAGVPAFGQTRFPGTAQQADPFDTPITADQPATVTRPPALRGTVGAPGTAATPGATTGAPATTGTLGAPRQPRPANFVREAPTLPRARTQRPVQGQVQRQTRRDTTGTVRRPVFDPRASTRAPTQIVDPAPPPRRRRAAEVDPFAPLGLRVGSFILRPSVEAGIGYSDNPTASTTTRTPSAFTRTTAELRVDSDWSSNQFGLRLRGERQDFLRGGIEERYTADTALTGRIDVTRDTQVDLGASYRRAPDSNNNTTTQPATAVGLPDLDTTSFTAGVTQRFGRAQLRLRGQYDQLRYGDTRLSDGTIVSNRDRDVNVTTATLRAGYELVTGFTPIVEASVNRRDFVADVSSLGAIQGSEGYVLRVGTVFDFGAKLRGEAAIGYAVQTPRDPTARPIDGITFDGTLEWSVTPLTTLRATARTGIIDTTIAGATGGLARDFTFAIEHALRRNFIVTSSLAFGVDDFAGITRTDTRLTAAIAATYRLNRNTSFRLSGTHQRVESTVPGNAQRTNTIEGSIRIEY